MANKAASEQQSGGGSSKKRRAASSAPPSSKDVGGNSKKKTRTSPAVGGGGGGNKKAAAGNQQQQQRQRQHPHPHRHARRHAEVVEEGKRLWNALRKKENTAEETRRLMGDLMPLIRGKCNQIAMQHDASRIVQAALQFGTPEERAEVLDELCRVPETPGEDSNNADKMKKKKSPPSVLVELCKSQYGHFAVLKAMRYCGSGGGSGGGSNNKTRSQDATSADLIVKSLRGHVAKLAVHAVGSRVVEGLFTSGFLPRKKTAPLKQELYGPHFSLFAEDALKKLPESCRANPTLRANVDASPDRRDQAVDFVRNLISKAIEKNLVHVRPHLQELLSEFVDEIDSREIRSSLSGPVAEHAIHYLSTKAGTKVVATAGVAYGTAKDRKRVLKSLKGYCRSGLLHSDAYLAFLRIVQLTDDTVSVQKNLLHELVVAAPAADNDEKGDSVGTKNDKTKANKKEEDDDDDGQQSSPLLDLALSETASKLFLMLLERADDDEGGDGAQRHHKFLDPYERSVLSPSNPTVQDEDGKEVPTSRKDPDVRRLELLSYLREPLVELCRLHAGELLRSRPGAAVLRGLYGTLLADGKEGGDSPVSAAAEAVVGAAVDACVSSLREGEEENGEGNEGPLPLFEDRDGHLAVKNLVLVDSSEEDGGGEGTFSREFYDRLKSEFDGDGGGDGLMKVAASNRGAFVVAAMCKVPSIRREVVGDLRRNRADIQDLMRDRKKKGEASAGYEALLKEISAATTK